MKDKQILLDPGGPGGGGSGGQQYVFVPYSYVVTTGSMNGGASSQQALTTDPDADFELHYLEASTSADGAANFLPNNFSVLITDKNNSRIWGSARVPQIHFHPGRGLELRRPVLIAKRSNLNLDFLNTTASTALTATVVFHGFKVFIAPSGMPNFNS